MRYPPMSSISSLSTRDHETGDFLVLDTFSLGRAPAHSPCAGRSCDADEASDVFEALALSGVAFILAERGRVAHRSTGNELSSGEVR